MTQRKTSRTALPTPEQVQERVSRAVRAGIDRFGSESQWRHIQEECAELIVAINHLVRKKASLDDVADEIADVILCMGTARLLAGQHGVDRRVLTKLARYEERLGLVEQRE